MQVVRYGVTVMTKAARTCSTSRSPSHPATYGGGGSLSPPQAVWLPSGSCEWRQLAPASRRAPVAPSHLLRNQHGSLQALPAPKGGRQRLAPTSCGSSGLPPTSCGSGVAPWKQHDSHWLQQKWRAAYCTRYRGLGY